jgi:hypothetical protein
MENTLTQLFDFLRFDGNQDLQQVVDSVHARYAAKRELSLDELSAVNAAGDPHPVKKEEQGQPEQ